ncbi:LysM peptidoglycan-binding domain-containing protein [Paenibacillus lentus]|uniref:LysM peptidoglycan-binding domain-containing protein n=1 Tax=Paenibacillus lentus TaxID=1338368 RepID=A0A3Q8SB24_9BACL|nr:LysM peptidoglycan-binding domain-containing protein [Paenibacillus lentus]AZK46514.1 LysM peptidoglycan-binding domain-containing protein [Paenibacillus lentus]
MKIHIVKKGDTLFDLSKKYNVPLQKLIEANPQISNPDQLGVGMKVKIPTTAVPVEEGIIYKHTVKQGDSLWKLAKAWGLPLQTLVSANPQLSDPNVLKVGEIINIPGAGSTGSNNPHDNIGANPAPISPAAKKNTAPKENIKPENVKTENIKPENIKPENVKPENIKPIAENSKPAPIAKPESIKLESVKVENIKIVENVMPMPVIPQQLPQMETKPMKYEETPCMPKQPCPELISPYQFQVEQPPMMMAEQQLPYPPCGCSGHSPQPDNLFQPYQVENEKVSSYYDFPPVWQNEVAMGEYPGLSNAPMYQSPQYVNPCAPEHYAHYGHHPHQAYQPYSYSEQEHAVPEQFWPNAPHPGGDNAPWAQASLIGNNASLYGANVFPNTPYSNSWHPPYHQPMHAYSPCGCSGHSSPIQPYANAPYLAQPYQGTMPNIPGSPLGGFGALDQMQEDCYKGGTREEDAIVQANNDAKEKASDTAQAVATTQQATKEARISEVKKSKQQGRDSASKGKKTAQRKKSSGRRKLWINQ